MLIVDTRYRICNYLISLFDVDANRSQCTGLWPDVASSPEMTYIKLWSENEWFIIASRQLRDVYVLMASMGNPEVT